jgi:hypothetical protein
LQWLTNSVRSVIGRPTLAVAQVSQIRLHGQAERSQRPPHRVPDPHDPLGDAIPGQQFAFAHTAAA